MTVSWYLYTVPCVWDGKNGVKYHSVPLKTQTNGTQRPQILLLLEKTKVQTGGTRTRPSIRIHPARQVYRLTRGYPFNLTILEVC
jgi:hypothetical protein